MREFLVGVARLLFMLSVMFGAILLIIEVLEIRAGRGPFVSGLATECEERKLHLCRAVACGAFSCAITAVDLVGERRDFKVFGPVLLWRGTFNQLGKGKVVHEWQR
jgi:hypothetical protein